MNQNLINWWINSFDYSSASQLMSDSTDDWIKWYIYVYIHMIYVYVHMIARNQGLTDHQRQRLEKSCKHAEKLDLSKSPQIISFWTSFKKQVLRCGNYCFWIWELLNFQIWEVEPRRGEASVAMGWSGQMWELAGGTCWTLPVNFQSKYPSKQSSFREMQAMQHDRANKNSAESGSCTGDCNVDELPEKVAVVFENARTYIGI